VGTVSARPRAGHASGREEEPKLPDNLDEEIKKRLLEARKSVENLSKRVEEFREGLRRLREAIEKLSSGGR